MARAREIAEALDECERDSWRCESCTAAAQEHSRWCRHCEVYWTETAPELFSDLSAPQEAQDE